MRTVRLPSMRASRGRGTHVLGGSTCVSSDGHQVLLEGGLHTEVQCIIIRGNPLLEQNDRQAPMKTLPSRNFFGW